MSPDIEIRPESGLWKDSLDKHAVVKLATQLGQAYKKFDQEGFVDSVVTKDFFLLELKQRIFAIAKGLKTYLPKKYSQAINIIIKTAPIAGTFENWAMLTYIEKYGLEHFQESVDAMKILTRYSSAEFAIRPFMIHHTKEMLPILHQWVLDKNEHVRRLAAEGTRPRGVWMPHVEEFKEDPTEVLKLLEKLKADSSLYVRKAVANNLNDISKDHPDIVIKTGKQWLKDNNKETNWIIKHTCRTLLKQGHPDVFPLFGFTENPKIEINNFSVERRRISIGAKARITLEIKSTSSKTQKLSIDYKMHYVKKNGKQLPKVFKFSEKTIDPNETIQLATTHSFQEMTTRTHYPGKHNIELMINGKSYKSVEFTLS